MYARMVCIFSVSIHIKTQTLCYSEPTDMTVTGMSPYAPPGHMRCEAHLTPFLLTDPARQTCPLGASHPIHDALPFCAVHFPTKQKVQVSDDALEYLNGQHRHGSAHIHESIVSRSNVTNQERSSLTNLTDHPPHSPRLWCIL